MSRDVVPDTSALIELELVDVLTSEAGIRGPAQALLRAHRSTRALLVPLGVAEAAQLACLLDGHALERPSWQALYTSSLAAGGLRVVDVQVERQAGAMSGFGARVQLGPLHAAPESADDSSFVSLVAPADAALLIALEARVPVYAARGCFRDPPPPRPSLATMPDEDFENVH